MLKPLLLSVAILVTLYAACEAIYIQRHRPATDPYACWGGIAFGEFFPQIC
ncbi:hypothetical protein [Bradyrhizobium sp. OK095]|uniref:hypothetical protein n=1 Tax=Bradyrhizobium sp. OK095 TaxID=1882760 RepID=UPI0008D1FF78|nr:hypothetical protein [Bradyrhizobium sp. OK095]SEN66443.1 hypothetical protein SAMN05443254_1107 [Bradyrhizobium sp. OK095]